MEAFAEGEAGDGAGGGIPGGDAAEGIELTGDLVEIEGGPKGVEAGGLAADMGGQETAFEAKDDDAGVEELFELDARDDADDGVIEGAAGGRGDGGGSRINLVRAGGGVRRDGFGHALPPR